MGISKKSHINYQWPSIITVGLFYSPLNLSNPSFFLRGILAPAQVLSTRISPKPSSVIPAPAQVLTFGSSPKPSSFYDDGITMLSSRRLILAWLHVFEFCLVTFWL